MYRCRKEPTAGYYYASIFGVINSNVMCILLNLYAAVLLSDDVASNSANPFLLRWDVLKFLGILAE